MQQTIFPMYTKSEPIYGEPGECRLPLAVVEKIGESPKARHLYNLANEHEAWFPESVFTYHWHVVNAEEFMVFLTIPSWIVKKKSDFFAKGETGCC